MKNASPEIDAYIAKSAEFARPILKKFRALFHKACPRIEETMKWGFPHFEHKGILCGVAAFKQHCAFNLWKASLLKDALGETSGEAMGQFGRITSEKDLPPRARFVALVKKAVGSWF